MAVRLLTFSSLSLFREQPVGTESMDSAVADLSAVVTTFDCHLLQRAEATRPLDVLGSAEQQSRLQAVMSGLTMNVVMVTESQQGRSEIPDWMNAVVQTATTAQEAAELVVETFDRDNTDLMWCHVEVPRDERWSPWVASCLQAARKAGFEGEDEILLVTATEGEAEDCGRFESLLWQGAIHVPLWIAGGATPFGRQPQPTGSFDVLETILVCLGATASDGENQACDLRRVLDTGDSDHRAIRLIHGNRDAIRTAEFFFVRSQSEESGEQTALYGKPHDIWNVHDVRREYPQVADELLEQL